MTNKNKSILGFTIGLFCISGIAIAASPHLKGGADSEPGMEDLGMTLKSTGEVSGVGNGDLLVTLEAEANSVVSCINPSGENQPPGAQPAPVFVYGDTLIPDEQTKNGWTSFSVETFAPEILIEGAPDCPNTLWTEERSDLLFTHAHLTFEQPIGNIVLEILCDIMPPSEDGVISKDDVMCISV